MIFITSIAHIIAAICLNGKKMMHIWVKKSWNEWIMTWILKNQHQSIMHRWGYTKVNIREMISPQRCSTYLDCFSFPASISIGNQFYKFVWIWHITHLWCDWWRNWPGHWIHRFQRSIWQLLQDLRLLGSMLSMHTLRKSNWKSFKQCIQKVKNMKVAAIVELSSVWENSSWCNLPVFPFDSNWWFSTLFLKWSLCSGRYPWKV